MKKLLIFVVFIINYLFVYAQQTPSVPQNLQVSDIDESSAVLSWSEAEDAYSYFVEYSVVSSLQVSTIETQDTQIYISDLVSSAHYIWKVKTIDASGDTSDWSNVAYFYTDGIYSACNEPEGLTVSTMDQDGITIQWIGDTDIPSWEIVCGNIGSNPLLEGTRATTSNMQYTFTDLIPYNTYQFALRSNCSSGTGQWNYIYAKYIPEDELAQFPVRIDFEDSVISNSVGIISGVTNSWVIAQAENNPVQISGQALYISNDNGNTSLVSNAKNSISYAYINFEVPFEAVQYYVDFSYKSDIVSQTTGMKLYMLSNGTSLNIDCMIDDEYSVSDTLYNNTNGEWVTKHIILPYEYTGSPRKLIFAWVNDTSASAFGSFAIDNIYITARYCAVPDSLKSENITCFDALLSWNTYINQQQFNLQYKSSQQENWNTLYAVQNPYFLEDLQPDETYFFRIQADCITEQSFYSEIDSFTTLTLIERVENPFVQPSYNNAVVSWQYNEEINQWIIVYKEYNTTDEWIMENVNSVPYTIENLLPNTEYVFKVRSVNSENQMSLWSDEIIFKTLCEPVVEYPYFIETELSYVQNSDVENLPECWMQETDSLFTQTFDFSNQDILQLSFELTSNSGTTLLVTTNSGQSYQFLENFPATSSYNEYTVILNNFAGVENVKFCFVFNQMHEQITMSKIKNIAINKACTSPIGVGSGDIGTQSAVIFWNTNGNQSDYLLKLYTVNNDLVDTYIVTDTIYTITDLDSLSTYKIALFSLCNSTESFDSTIFYFTTLGTIPNNCPLPQNFYARWYQTKGEEILLATWTQEEDIYGWQIYYKKNFAYNWEEKTVRINPVFTLRNLEIGEQYYIKIRTICISGDTSDFSPTDTVYIGGNSSSEILENEYSVTLYPNPATSKVEIQTQGLTIENATLTNIQGKKIMYWEILPSVIDIGCLPKGVYNLVGYIQNKKIYKKIIKQ